MFTSPQTRNRAESESSTDTEQERYHHWQRHFLEPRTTSGALVLHPHRRHYPIPRSRSVDSERRSGIGEVHEGHSHYSPRPSPISRPSRSKKPRSRSRGRSIHVDVFNNVNDSQTVDHNSLYSRSRSSSVSIPHGPSRSNRRVRRGYTPPPRGVQISADWPWPWASYPYTYSDPRPSWLGPHTWKDESNANGEANAMAICNVRGRSRSPHHHHRHYSPSPHWPHIPPLKEEKDLIRAQIRLEEDKEEAAKKRAVDEWIIRQKKEEDEKKHIIEDAIREDHEKQEKKKQREKEEKERWAAEEEARKKKEEDAKKTKEKEIDDEIRRRMSKAGYHNEAIEAAIAAKKGHYCHDYRRTSAIRRHSGSPSSKLVLIRRR